MKSELIESSMMKPQPLVNLFKHAMKTFSPKSSESFQEKFSKLKIAMDKIRAPDLGLDENYFSNFVINKSNAPCTYIEVYEDSNINMSVFILKPDFKMPLHDHPHMHGLLKMVWGTAQVKSYSEIVDKSQIDILRGHLTPQWRDPRFDRSIFTHLTTEKLFNDESECCVLTPNESNFHEITAVGGYAAFLDILSPPYSSAADIEVEEDETRDCHYYETDHSFGDKIFHFSEIPPPPHFYCSQGPYTGPEL